MSIADLRAAVTTAGGTPTAYNEVGLLRQLITAKGGTPTQYSVNMLLREAITAWGGTPTSYEYKTLLRQFVTALGGSPATYSPDALWAQIAPLATSFSPLSFAPVAFYDASDRATLFQTGTRASPGAAVAADGDPVGLMLDKSGNAFDLTQATAGKRPLYKTSGGLSWLQFDGVDDVLTVNAAALRIVGDLTLSAAAYKNAGSTYGGILTCQTGAGTVNAYEWRFQNHATSMVPEFVCADGSAASTVSGVTNSIGPLATAGVMSVRRTSGATIEFSLNKARDSGAFTRVPTADASSVFAMGDRNAGGTPLGGRIYAAFVKDSLLSNPNLASLETWLGAKVGLTI
jgi:hypothetical protein